MNGFFILDLPLNLNLDLRGNTFLYTYMNGNLHEFRLTLSSWTSYEDKLFWFSLGFVLMNPLWGHSFLIFVWLCPHEPLMRTNFLDFRLALSSWTPYEDILSWISFEFVLMNPLWGQTFLIFVWFCPHETPYEDILSWFSPDFVLMNIL